MGKHKNKHPRVPEDDCNHCGENTPITEESAYIVNFRRCFGNFVMNKCIHCGGETRLFLGGEVQEQFEKQGIPVANTDQIPDPDFVETFLRINNIPLPESKELTPDEEDYVATRGLYLQTIDVTAEDFERTT